MKRYSTILTTLLAFSSIVNITSAQTLLSVDINDRQSADGVADTVPGFLSYTMSGTSAASSALETRTLGGYSVSLIAVDDGLDENTVTAGVQNGVGAIDDRDRATPSNGGSLTYAQIYDDLIFAGVTVGPSGGMNLTISGGALQANTPYSISIYTFDSGSTPLPQPRTANWLDGNNANALVTSTSFSGAALPTSDFQYRFTGTAMTDGAGTLLLLGRNTTANAASGATSIGVILNGFEIAQVPEPGTIALGLVGIVALGLRSRGRR